MSAYFLGVDIGNSKSHAVIAGEAGEVVGVAATGPGSWEAIGWEAAGQVMRALVGEALARAGLRSGQIAGAGFGLAGYDWPEDRAPYEAIVRSLGLGGPFELVNDALLGLLIGAAEGWGVCVSAGTSCNSYGRDRAGRIGRMTGHSGWFGEAAGAYEIVVRARQKVAHQWTRRGPETALSEAFVSLCGASDVEDLLAGLVRGRYRLGPEHAPLVFEVAAAGDAVAQGIITWAGEQLGDLARGVIRQLELEEERFEVVLSGSVYDNHPALAQLTGREIQTLAPGARTVRLQAPPVLGGVILGMQEAGVGTVPVRAHLLEEGALNLS